MSDQVVQMFLSAVQCVWSFFYRIVCLMFKYESRNWCSWGGHVTQTVIIIVSAPWASMSPAVPPTLLLFLNKEADCILLYIALHVYNKTHGITCSVCFRAVTPLGEGWAAFRKVRRLPVCWKVSNSPVLWCLSPGCESFYR